MSDLLDFKRRGNGEMEGERPIYRVMMKERAGILRTAEDREEIHRY